MNADARLLALLDWLRARLETLKKLSRDEFVERNLEALARAVDPDTNPRLRTILEDLNHRAADHATYVDHPTDPEDG